MDTTVKYPRTYHLAGSGLQAGDDLPTVSFRELAGRHLVLEEKVDGANCGIRFDRSGRLFLQSRGHYLSGGPRERQFELFKSWCAAYASQLFQVLSDRYLLYGEWLYAKHSLFYDQLPHYFMEFDIFDLQRERFLSTVRRRELLSALPFVTSVRVLYEGQLRSSKELTDLIGPSAFMGPHLVEHLREEAQAQGLDPDQVLRETDTSDLMEGLYIKLEDEEQVLARYKFVRSGFLQTLLDSGEHWANRPLLPNRLRDNLSIWDV